MKNLPQKHLTGIEFFRFSNLQPLNADEYFECLNLLRPLFKDPDFISSTPGFYLNRITNTSDDKGDSVRLTYYTIDPTKTLKSIDAFVEKNDKISIFNSSDSKRPDIVSLNEHNQEELRFSNFLNKNTQICLEMLEKYGEHSFQEKVIWCIHIGLPQKIHPKLFLYSIFEEYSGYFNDLKKNSLDNQYWEDLVFNHEGKNFGLHFMANMVAVPEYKEITLIPNETQPQTP